MGNKKIFTEDNLLAFYAKNCFKCKKYKETAENLNDFCPIDVQVALFAMGQSTEFPRDKMKANYRKSMYDCLEFEEKGDNDEGIEENQ